MKVKPPFPDGHDPRISEDIVFTDTGTFNKDFKGKSIRIKGISEQDIIEIRQMLLDEIKQQKKKDDD